MKNLGIDLMVWKQLKEKWTKLDASGCLLRIGFKLIISDSEKDKTLAVDVIQTIDNEIVVETVQRMKGEAYTVLGISDLSVERLKDVYKEAIAQLHSRLGRPESNLVITMSPTSELSGEVTGYLQSHDEPVKRAILTNYQHYYILNALREKMAESVGNYWKKVKTIYLSDALEFYFEY